MRVLKEWLKPIRWFLKIFGIHLPIEEKDRQNDYSLLSIAITLFWIVLNFGSNISDCLLPKTDVPKESTLETFIYNRYIDDWAWCIHSAGIQVGLLIFAHRHWPTTLKLIQVIESNLNFSETSYRKLWSVMLIGLFHIGIMVS